MDSEQSKNRKYYLKYREKQLTYKKTPFFCEVCKKNIVVGAKAQHVKTNKHKYILLQMAHKNLQDYVIKQVEQIKI
jgi:hypothetical protein